MTRTTRKLTHPAQIGAHVAVNGNGLAPDGLDIVNSDQQLLELLDKHDIDLKKVIRTAKYKRELAVLQIELVKLQRSVQEQRRRVAIIFEGRDAAGKGGTIQRFTQHLNPRAMRVVALPKPSEVEMGQWYFQRYANHLPNPGEITFFGGSSAARIHPIARGLSCAPRSTSIATPISSTAFTAPAATSIERWRPRWRGRPWSGNAAQSAHPQA